MEACTVFSAVESAGYRRRVLDREQRAIGGALLDRDRPLFKTTVARLAGDSSDFGESALGGFEGDQAFAGDAGGD